MHQVLYIVAEGTIEKDAVENALECYERWLDRDGPNNGPYDYAVPMVDGRKVSGSDRWTQFKNEPVAVKANSSKGEKWIKNGWNNTRSDFNNSLSEIKDEIMNKTADEIREDMMMRHYFGQLYDMGGTGIYLYNATLQEHVSPHVQTSEKYEQLQSNKEGNWVVPLDAHS